ncbi:hypothetical protein HDR59_03040 [bacterium]|nr:hypothetical protein [bacterium]
MIKTINKNKIKDFFIKQFIPAILLIGVNVGYTILLFFGLFPFGPNVEPEDVSFVAKMFEYYDDSFDYMFIIGLLIASFLFFITSQIFVFKNLKNPATKTFAFFDFYFLAISIGLLMLYSAIN